MGERWNCLGAYERLCLVKEAGKKGIRLMMPVHFHERIAEGVVGEMEDEVYTLGKLSFIRSRGIDLPPVIMEEYARRQNTGEKMIFLAQGETVLGGITFTDQIRPETRNVFAAIRKSGIRDIVLLSGDRGPIAKKIGKAVGLDQVLGDLLPEQKVEELKRIRERVQPIAMVGDGVNDAPALAAADVGIAMGAHGTTVASETADIVITVDALSRVHEAFQISRRMLRVANQGIFFGMGMSLVFMMIAAFGYITPISGAILQEVLDVAVILNALRVHKRKAGA
jgi:P-type E1-E2 ATPase